MRHLTISQIRTLLEDTESLSAEERTALAGDSRKGVQQLFTRYQRQEQKSIELKARYENMLIYERQQWAQGVHWVAGIDEVGRGPLAGPVVASAVILSPETHLVGVNDSKQLSPKERAEMAKRIKNEAADYAIGCATPKEIDELNIYQASIHAMMQAVKQLETQSEHLLVDAMRLPIAIEQTSLVKGDSRSASIAAASILAKETRDQMMREADVKYPGYGLGEHMGYPTKQHLEALKSLGPTPIHRRSFAPVKQVE